MARKIETVMSSLHILYRCYLNNIFHWNDRIFKTGNYVAEDRASLGDRKDRELIYLWITKYNEEIES